MKFDPDTCLTSMRRSLGRGGSCVRRCGDAVCLFEQPAPADPNTHDQRCVRLALRCCAEAWRAMACAEREQWHATARGLRPQFQRQAGHLTGYSLLVHCGLNCLVTGTALPATPPVTALRPGLPRSVELLPDTDARRFRFAIRHDVAEADCARHRVVVRITPACVRVCRTPETRNRRLICGYGPTSAPALPPSGQVLGFAAARFAVEPGRRLGVWLRIVRLPDGLDSGELFIDVMRAEGGEGGKGAYPGLVGA